MLQHRARGGVLDLGATEFAIRDAMHRAGTVLLEHVLDGDHGGHRGPQLSCGCGEQAEFVDYRRKGVLTVLGEVQVRRAYYHCACCAHGTIPKDEELDIVGSSVSPGVRRLLARVGAQEAFEAGSRDLAELAGIEVKTKEVERVSEACGEAMEQAAARERAAVVAGKVVALRPEGKLYVVIDGTGVPVVKRECAAQGKDGGPAKTREAKLGCVFTQHTVDAEGYPVRAPHSTTYVGAIESCTEFGPRIHAEALRRGLKCATDVVALADGAPWIWNLVSEQFPGAVQIVDLYHAREHLAEVARVVYANAPEQATAWGEVRREELDAGDVPLVIRALKRLRPQADAAKEVVRKAIDYFATNEHRMSYAAFRRQGYFVGSGVIEAGCRTIIGQRLKQSGMHWTVRGANAIIALRCSLLSNRWDDHWKVRAVG